MSSLEVRGNHDGTTSYRVKFTHHGKRMTRTFIDEPHATSWKALLDTIGAERALHHLAAPAPTTPQRTTAEQVRHHIAHLTGVTQGTRTKYERIAAARLSGDLERVLLRDLTRDHVSRWVNAQTGSPKTIKNAHSLLSAALSSAVRDGHADTNVAKGVQLPRLDSSDDEHIYLTKQEVGVLLSLVGEHWRPLIAFLAQTGCRFSEATALAVGSLDIPQRQARISRAWKYTAGATPVLGAPKTRKSRRTIVYPPSMAAMLELHTAGKRADAFVFTNTRGNPVRNGPFHEGVWQPIMDDFEQLTGKRPRPHDLRHSFVNWAIQAKTSLPIIQRQLGHESIKTTVDVYGSLVPSDLDEMAENIEADMPAIPTGPRVRQIEG